MKNTKSKSLIFIVFAMLLLISQTLFSACACSDLFRKTLSAPVIDLELEEKEMIKTFSFDANEEYTTKVTGQGITTGGRLETMPNFIGKTISEVETWASEHDILLNTEFVDSDSEFYNPNTLPGMIANQSISPYTLIHEISELTIYINNATYEPIPNPDDNQDVEPDDNQENNTNNDIPDIILPSEGTDEEETNLD